MNTALAISTFFDFALKQNSISDELRRQIQQQAAQAPKTDAAVLVLFSQTHKLENSQIILTQRSQKLHHHAGQISFAGGKKDPQDPHLIHTALREAQEEIGIPPSEVSVYGTLPTIPTRTGYNITPVLAASTWHSWQTNLNEVDEILHLPAHIALNPNNYQQEQRSHQQKQHTTLKLPYLHHDIWGATAVILYQLALNYQQIKQIKTRNDT